MNVVVTEGADILALTETWLGTNCDPFVIAESVDAGYGCLHISHKEGDSWWCCSYL